ncbi:serine/arginine repetitive matrix protein 2-like [Dreissena polymorpha]|uniref:Uncharacterized protein n=1 Tax=Dreissena polymorpha TaxID=45954 RepID=A0A9D4GN21_DREPO|nr:serine/arginine repetitive matrix protein 2-like [Dreissena polymorpha]KAH3816887.1 hypothetical protein DPMN_118411 [Dreissena polymorpha]
MSDTGGGSSVGLIAGAGIGGVAIVVGIIALVVYCYMKARKEQANTNMTKSMDVFSTGASNTQFDLPQRSRVNQFPDPAAARKSRQKGREQGRDQGHVNTAYSRHSSDTSSNSSDVEGRDLSPPRVRKPRGDSYASDTSNDESSSLEEEIPGGEVTFRMEKETDKRARGSYKKARQNNILDLSDTADGRRNKRREPESQHTSRRDTVARNPRSDSPLTIGTLKKHEEITGGGTDSHDNRKTNVNNRVKKRDTSPSTRTYESSETGVTQASSQTAGTEFTATTVSSGTRFQKNPSLRRNSPARSSSQRRYRKDHETDEKGRRKPRRTRSAERERSERQSQRSRSPGSGSERSERSGSSSRSGSTRSSRRSRSEQQRQLKEQAILPIFQDAKKKKGSFV